MVSQIFLLHCGSWLKCLQPSLFPDSNSNYQSFPANLWVIICDYLLGTLFNSIIYFGFVVFTLKIWELEIQVLWLPQNPLWEQKIKHHNLWRIDDVVIWKDLDLIVVIVIGLDTHVKYDILCMVGHPRMLMLLRLTQKVINRFIHRNGNTTSSYSFKQVCKRLYK